MVESYISKNTLELNVNNVDVYLKNLDFGQGKITISDSNNHNFSFYWGSMGSTIIPFLCKINADYFANKLSPYNDMRVIDIKKTFAQLRKFIREDLDLPFYKHMEFQKQLREELKDFQNDCEERGINYFVEHFFTTFVNSLDFYLIKNKFERKYIEKDFNSIEEHWSFIYEKNSPTYMWLYNFHPKLKKELIKL